jgi:hypothetical protein
MRRLRGEAYRAGPAAAKVGAEPTRTGRLHTLFTVFPDFSPAYVAGGGGRTVTRMVK